MGVSGNIIHSWFGRTWKTCMWETLKRGKIHAPAGSESRKGRKQTYWTTSRKLALKRVYLLTLAGIPYAVANCQACFDLQGNGDLLDIL